MPYQALDGLCNRDIGSIADRMHLDPGALLLHVIDHTPTKGIGVVQSQSRALILTALVVQVLRPLMAIAELQGFLTLCAVFRFGFDCNTQPLLRLEEYGFIISCEMI
jgi:hypothetical protein